MFFFFFFSSRRRHTRWNCHWSSDVCSSDLSYAGPGVGSTPHLGGELFRLTYKLDLVHVPFTGAAPAVQATVGNHTPVAFTALPSSLAAIQAGQVRAIGVAATERARSEERRVGKERR